VKRLLISAVIGVFIPIVLFIVGYFFGPPGVILLMSMPAVGFMAYTCPDWK
jgi:hypothetical protein